MLQRSMAVLLALLLITQALMPHAAALAAGRDDGGKDDGGGRLMRVAASSLNLRGGPGTQHAVLRSLTRGTPVTVVAEQGDWLQVRLEDGTTGWAAAQYLTPAAAGTPATGEPVGQPARPGESAAQPSRAASADRGAASPTRGGGSTLRAVAKWGCLAGAVVAGGLWLTARSSGNDAYDEYQTLFRDGQYDAADAKYNETLDHDDRAQLYAIGGGVLLGLFVLQQFVLHHDAGDQAAADGVPRVPALTLNRQRDGLRIALVAVRP
jgi:hypothetical protein